MATGVLLMLLWCVGNLDCIPTVKRCFYFYSTLSKIDIIIILLLHNTRAEALGHLCDCFLLLHVYGFYRSYSSYISIIW